MTGSAKVRPAVSRVSLIGWSQNAGQCGVSRGSVFVARSTSWILETNVLVRILSLPTCVRCDGTVASLTRFAGDYPGMVVERLNIADSLDILERYGLLSFEYSELATHAVVINGTLAGLEHPSEDLLRLWLDQAVAEEVVRVAETE